MVNVSLYKNGGKNDGVYFMKRDSDKSMFISFLLMLHLVNHWARVVINMSTWSVVSRDSRNCKCKMYRKEKFVLQWNRKYFVIISCSVVVLKCLRLLVSIYV